MEKVISRNPHADLFIHLGDGADSFCTMARERSLPHLAVSGNCDRGLFTSLCDLPKELCTQIGGRRFFLCHGDAYSVKWDYDRIVSAGIARNADAVLFGHTHISLCDYRRVNEKSLYLVNPGSIREGCYASASIRPCGMLFNCTTL